MKRKTLSTSSIISINISRIYILELGKKLPGTKTALVNHQEPKIFVINHSEIEMFDR